MDIPIPKGRLQLLLWASVITGFLALLVGGIAAYNIIAGLAGWKAIAAKVVPANLGLALVETSVGLTLTAMTYYRRKLVLHTSMALVGLGLAVAAALIQDLSTIATLLDSLVTQEDLGASDILLGFIRADALIGYASAPLLYGYTRVLKSMLSTTRGSSRGV